MSYYSKTDGPTDRRTDTDTYRVTCTRLKIEREREKERLAYFTVESGYNPSHYNSNKNISLFIYIKVLISYLNVFRNPD